MTCSREGKKEQVPCAQAYSRRLRQEDKPWGSVWCCTAGNKIVSGRSGMVHTGQEQHAKEGHSIMDIPLFFPMPTVIAMMSRKGREETAPVNTFVCQIWWHGMLWRLAKS